MPTIITKVKKQCQEKSAENQVGWSAVLRDIQRDVKELQKLIPIVKRKIARREPWPADSLQQKSPQEGG